MEGETLEESEAGQGGRGPEPRPVGGEGAGPGQTQIPAGRKAEGGQVARGSARRVWWPRQSCAVSPCPVLAHGPRAGSLTWGRAGEDGVCAAGLPPEKAPRLAALLQEGELGQADF